MSRTMFRENMEGYSVNLCLTEFVQPTRKPSISVSELSHVNNISWLMSLNSAVTLWGGPPGAKNKKSYLLICTPKSISYFVKYYVGAFFKERKWSKLQCLNGKYVLPRSG